MIDKELVKTHFSKNALNYNQYAHVQKKMKEHLVQFMKHQKTDLSSIRNILEIGCGTGYLTQFLLDAFPDASITAIDIAPGMIAAAQSKFKTSKICFICADIEEFHLESSYDLIISNATFQWFNHLSDTINKLYQTLSSNGLFFFSTFGKHTFSELKESYHQVSLHMNLKEPIQSGQSFLSLSELQILCKNSTSKEATLSIDELYEIEYFDHALEFMKSVKKIGAGNSNANSTSPSPAFLKNVIQFYNKTYKEENKIKATYHCLFCGIKKKGETMYTIENLKDTVLNGMKLGKEEALFLANQDTSLLNKAANEIREHFCQNEFELCSIVNAKSGNCSEDCKYCAQSSHYSTTTELYGLLPIEKILEHAKSDEASGILRFSIVTSGKYLNETELDHVCKAIETIKKETNLEVCISLGLLTKEQFIQLKKAGASRVHNNLESSKNYFPSVCTTHSYEDKIKTIKAAMEAGLFVCSGGIMGLGESMEDRIDMALELRELGIQSIPINLLNPIPGTPFQSHSILSDELLSKIVSIFRFLMPTASIRLAGGRGCLGDKGKHCFESGANAAISGNMLTTAGITTTQDLALLDELGFELKLTGE